MDSRFQEASPAVAIETNCQLELRWRLGLDLWGVPNHLDELGTVCVALNCSDGDKESERHCGNRFLNQSKTK